MIRRFSVNFALLSMVLDASSVGLGLWGAAVIRPKLNQVPFVELLPPTVSIPGALFVYFPLIWILIFSALSIYDGRKFLRAVDEFAFLTLGTMISAVSAAGILYFSYRDVSRALFLVFVLATYTGCLGWRVAARAIFRIRKASPDKMRRILIVGVGPLGQRIQAQIEAAGTDDFSVAGFVDDIPDPSGAVQVLGSASEIKDVIQSHAVNDVVIALPHSAYHQMGEIVKDLDGFSVRVWVALGFFDLALYRTEIEDFAGIPMLDLRASAIDGYQLMVKRAFDVVLGSLALLVSLPVMALVSLAILVEDGGPVLFRQTRVGENGRLFEILKFRTMVKDAERLRGQVQHTDQDGNLIHKTRQDPRVTRVGRVLRRFSLDELPQLLNVFLGSMSLVGPRPELPYLVEKYQPWQRKRFAVPPGITGWWQVNGRSDKPMHLHTEDDLYYIQNFSIWLDLQILVKTVWVVLFGRGAF